MGKIGYSMENINEQVREIDTELKDIEEHLEQGRLRLNVIKQQAQEYSTDSKIVNQCEEDEMRQKWNIAFLEIDKLALLKKKETLIALASFHCYFSYPRAFLEMGW
nr:hypothetical protein CFP56_10830 [Quercus suber]